MIQDYWDQILQEAARKDDTYQALLRRCEAVEPDYRRILDGLTAQQQEQLESYIAICEEMEHRLTILACQIPRGPEPAV